MKKILVTGGGGFLGSAICRQLIEKNYNVVSYSRKSYSHLQKLGVQCFEGDLNSPEDLKKAMEGCDAVIHTAALAGFWGDYAQYYRVNVEGTKNVISVMKNLNINHLVYTSSPSVAFDKDDLTGVDETISYPKEYLSPYPKTKSIAEQFVLSENSDIFFTTALRPHLIWGPEDPHFMPRLIEKAKKNKLKIIGDGTNRVDIIYVDNAAQAHVQALEKLGRGSPLCGQAYFLGQSEPVLLWEFLNSLLATKNLGPITQKISFKIAYNVAYGIEKFFSFMKLKKEPPLTRFLALQLGKSHFFDHSKARKDFDYFPSVSTEEGLKAL